ncbi:MAG TPA: tetratricopeptide repeat protein [Pyrinomonadaceae bacterium]|nr:tetratricopeptide repeat protein [Pyrinomonadaceae bacterium]
MLLLLGIYITMLGLAHEAIAPSLLFVQQGFLNSISGHVTDGRSAIPNLQVELLNDMDSVIQRTKTDSSGLFAFRRLSTGIFQVRVQTYGTSYIGQTKRVQLERTRAFEQVDFVLGSNQTSSISPTGGAVFVQEVPEQARREFDRGSDLLKNDRREEGIAALKKAVEMFPSYFAALELLGMQYVKQQEYEPAIALLTKAVEVNRRAYQSLYGLSVAQQSLKQLPQAVESMRRAITLNPGSVNANLWMGMLLRQAAKLDEAETYLKQADKLAASKSPDAHWQLALLFNDLKRYREAADELELFLKVQPDSKDTDLIKKLIQRLRQNASNGGTKQ